VSVPRQAASEDNRRPCEPFCNGERPTFFRRRQRRLCIAKQKSRPYAIGSQTRVFREKSAAFVRFHRTPIFVFIASFGMQSRSQGRFRSSVAARDAEHSQEITMNDHLSPLSLTSDATPNDHLLAELQTHSYRPFQDEPDATPLPDGLAIPNHAGDHRAFCRSVGQYKA